MTRAMGLRSQIVIAAGLLVGASLLFCSLLLIRMGEQERLNEAVRVHLEQGELLTTLLAQQPDDQKRRALLATACRELAIPAFLLTDHDQSSLAGTLRPSAAHQSSLLRALRGQTEVQLHYPTLWQLLRHSEIANLELTLPVDVPKGASRALLLHIPLDGIQQKTLDQLRLAFIICLGYGLVLVITAVAILQKAVIRPVVELTSQTRQLANGNWHSRAQIHGPREIAELGTGFNHMAAALEDSHRLLEQQLAQLQEQNTELQATRSELVREARMSSIGHLAAGIAHEIGNPLSALIGYLELLRRKGDDSQQDLLQRALHESERIDRLIRDLLDYAGNRKIRNGEAKNTDTCDPLAVVQATCELLHQQGALKQRQLDLELPAHLPQVRMAAHKLQQILVNLLINARDATQDNGQIHIGGCSHPLSVEIWLRDDGCGMTSEQQQAAFDPFYSSKTGQGEQRLNRGLGLFVCYQLLEECGGDILLTSAPAAGTCFTLSLPRAAASQQIPEDHPA
ncbi:MAG: HAMP domain-containing histidine kinase [Desulfuromonadaceae bacterium]|nr:HAMP domain-containing histidine kinase [Desulfuromonadaceae bacterium]